MDKYLKPNPELKAKELVESLRVCIRNLVKFVDQIEQGQISLTDELSPEFKAWIAALSFMARKICALYLGTTDYDYGFKDISFTLIKRADYENK